MKKGFISLIVILTVSAVALVISSTVLLRSITETQLSIDGESINKAWAVVNSCAETALLSLASSTGPVTVWNNYTPDSATVSVGDDSCYYVITGSGTSSPRTIHASSSVNFFVRKISIEVSTNTPSVIVDSWDMVADF